MFCRPFSAACMRKGKQQQPSFVAKAQVETDSRPGPDPLSLRSIDGLDTDYCDDFQCTSSPAVEQTVRSLARELSRGRYTTTSLYQKGVQYSDGFRSFSGAEGYLRQRWIVESITKPRMTISKMRMLDKGTSQVEWRVEGLLGGSTPVDIALTTTCEHNLLTGRITTHKEKWDLRGCSPPTAAMVTFNRMAWSAKRMAGDAKDGLAKAGESISSSLDGDAGGGSGNNFLPGGMVDPTKFYQNDGPGPQQDIAAVGMVIALLYLASQLWTELEKIG